MTNTMEQKDESGSQSRFSRLNGRQVSEWTAKVGLLAVLIMGGLMLSWAVLVWAPWTDAFYTALANDNSLESSLSMPVAFVTGVLIAWLLSILVITKFVRHRGQNGWIKAVVWMLMFGLLTAAATWLCRIFLGDHLSRDGALGDIVSMMVTFFSFAVLLYSALLAGRFMGVLSPGEIAIGPKEG